MIRPTDKEAINGPLPDPNNPHHCARCDQDLFYECLCCKTFLGNRPPTNGDTCPECGSTSWTGPQCICNVCDCGED